MLEHKELKLEDIKREAEERRCRVQRALYYIEKFLSEPMCGKCFPCAFGTYEAKIRLKDIVSGKGKEADVFALRRIAGGMIEAPRCKKGRDTAKFILEWMDTDVFKEHVDGRCPDRECLALIEYRIIPGKCIMCGECQVVCKFNAIIGEKKKPYLSGYLPFEIIQKRSTKCGECVKVCPTEAIEIVDVKSKEPVGV
ncbi:MAG: 4Fe-4S dicluster domain-containing protein [Nitrospirae bacterium]|nr:4Fe-4S dicluster domain-containing protein [Nitrospirota bacterium]